MRLYATWLLMFMTMIYSVSFALDDFVSEDEANEISGTSTNSFILDIADNGGDVKLQFGDTLDESLVWNEVALRFDLSDTLRVAGNLEQNGTVLTLDAENAATGQNVSLVANQGSDNDGEFRYNATTNQWEISNDGGAFFGLDAPVDSNDSIFYAYDAAGLTALSTAPTDITFDTEIREDSAFTHAADSAEVTINTTGNYLIDYACTADVITDDRSTIDHYLAVDTGGGFTEVSGTRSASYHRTTVDGTSTAVINHYQSFATGDILKFQVIGDSNGNLVTTPNGCRLRIKRVDDAQGLIGPQGPTGPEGPAGADGTDGVSGGGWGDDGTTTSTALNASVTGDLDAASLTVDSECGPYGMFAMERGTVVSNASWAIGNGQTPFGSPMGCPGTVQRFAATCTGSIGTSLTAVIRKNNVPTTCTLTIPTTVGQVAATSCSESFTASDVVGVYAGTEVGAWTECVGTFWVKYD